MLKRMKGRILKSAILIMILFICCKPEIIFSQGGEEFVPHGNPMALIFSDFNYSFNKSGNASAFEITRAYLGYEYFLSKKFYTRITLDVADPGTGGLQMTDFLKFAYLQYKSEKLSARFGMVPTTMYSLQESVWGYRYIAKTFQDAYKLGPSADLGASVEYSPVSFVSVDFAMFNGEGFKRIQTDSTFKTALGVTIKPVKGLSLRAYYDIMDDNIAQTTTAFFAGYAVKKFRAGFEYSFQNNNEMKNEHDLSGFSFFSSLGVSEKITLFARYDYLKSGIPASSTDPWNKNRDGQVIFAGFDYTPVKGVRIAPVLQEYIPYNESLYITSKAGLYFELRF
jgi:hypothetical protein